MNTRVWRCLVYVLTACLLAVGLSNVRAQDAADPEWYDTEIVRPGEDGKLVYKADEQGNTIPDFSNAGFMGGGIALPDVATVMVIEPGDGERDDTERIQNAIKQLSAREPDEHGFRGALLLKRGKYKITKPIQVTSSGIVIRGEGQGPDGSVIYGWGAKYDPFFNITGSDAGFRDDMDQRAIRDAFVPAGAKRFRVESTDGYAVGDAIAVVRPATETWRQVSNGINRGWTEAGYRFAFERTITAIDGDTVTIDAPIVEPLAVDIAPSYIARRQAPGRIELVGVENLRMERGGQGVVFNHIENAWVRHVTTKANMYATVGVRHHAKHITIQDCAYLDPVGPIKGGYRYGFNLNGQLTLVQRCYARNGRHDFVMHDRGKGPNVFLDCLGEKAHSDSGPHHRWSVGTLYDNVIIEGNGLTAKDAGGRGTGHGWTGITMVFFNCDASYLNIQDPPIGQNYCIGCKGKMSSPRYRGTQGYWEAWRDRVKPRSLYLKQLEDRLGEQAVLNVTTSAQRAGRIDHILRETLSQ